MNKQDDPLSPHRSRLLGLAYRMLGSRADAEDVLQDAYLRFQGVGDVINPDAYLVTIVSRLCMDRLKSARARRETYVGPWLPEPVMDGDALSPDTALEMADDLSFALMLVLDRLTPVERAAFLLHDVFDLSFSEIAATIGKSVVACRQLACRARKAVRAERSIAPVSRAQQAKVLAEFRAAISSGDVAALMAVMHNDVVLLSDGGGIKPAALNPILGSDRISRYLIGVTQKFGANIDEIRSEPRFVNGAIGIVSYIGDALEQVLSIAVVGDKISAIYVVRNPQKLVHLLSGGVGDAYRACE